MSSRILWAFTMAAASVVGCARPPSSVANRAPEPVPKAVARHVMVLVTEDIGDEKRDSIVIAEPLGDVGVEAFNVKNAAYNVGFAWDFTPRTGRCLAISLARHGDPLGPDFKASGCVPIDEPSATVASLDRAGGGAIEVAAWFFDTSAPMPEMDTPRSTVEAATSRFHSGGRM